MELTCSLSKLQGALLSLGNRNLLNFKDTTDDVVKVLKEVITEDDFKLNATLFMILNTDLKVSEELKNEENVGLFTHITPLIDKNFVIYYLYELGLQTNLNAIIANCPTTLTTELIEVILKNLQNPGFHKNEYGVEHLYKFWSAIFIKMWRIDMGHHLDCNKKLEKVFKELHELIQKIIQTAMQTCLSDSFIGINLFHFFESIYFFLDLHINQNLCDNFIYKLNLKTEKSDDKKCSECIDLVLKNLPKTLEFLTVDIWMSLAENSYNNIPLQEQIGYCIYKISELGYCIPSDVLNYLAILKIKPRTESDKIAEASVEEIINEVEAGKSKWFKALVATDLTDEKVVACLLKNLNLAETEDLEEILKSAFQQLKENARNELMRNLFLQAVAKLSDWSIWLEKTTKEPILNHENVGIVEVFNKISESTPISEMVCLCMQSPQQTVKKICNLAVFDSNQLEYCIQVLKILQYPCEKLGVLDSSLLAISKELSVREKQGFVKVIRRLWTEGLVGLGLTKLVMEAIREYLKLEDFEKAVWGLEILKVLDKNEIVLVFLAQVLGHLSWDFKSFSTIKADGRENIGDIVVDIVQELKERQDTISLEWARKEISKYWEVDQAYFCDLWFLNGKKWIGSGMFHSRILALAHSKEGMADPEWERNSVVLSLTTVLPLLSSRRWEIVFSRLMVIHTTEDVIDIFTSVLYLLTLRLTPDIYPCFEHCVVSYGRCLKPYPSDFVFQKCVFFLEAITNLEERKSCTLILSFVLLESLQQTERNETEIEADLQFLDSDFREAARKHLKGKKVAWTTVRENTDWILSSRARRTFTRARGKLRRRKYKVKGGGKAVGALIEAQGGQVEARQGKRREQPRVASPVFPTCSSLVMLPLMCVLYWFYTRI